VAEERLKRLAQDLREGRLAPVYLFEGDDNYRKTRALYTLARAAAAGEGDGTADVERLGAVPAAALCERARTASFFAERRVLVGAGVEKYTERDLAAASQYAEDPAPAAVVVFWVDGKLDRRRKTYKFFTKLGAVYTFPYLSGAARRARIAAEAERLELKLGADGLAYLDRALAADLFTIIRELEKLAVYADGAELSADDVAAAATTSRVESAYDMVRFVAEGKVGPALAAIRQLLLAGQRPESLVGLLARQLRLIWLAKELGDAGLSRGELASRLGVAPYFVGEYTDAAARLSAERLAGLHKLLAELDHGVKTGRVPAPLALELFAARAGA